MTAENAAPTGRKETAMRQKTFVLNPSIRYIKRGGRMSEMVSRKPVNVGDVGILVCSEHVPALLCSTAITLM